MSIAEGNKLSSAQKNVIRKMREGYVMYKSTYFGTYWLVSPKGHVSSVRSSTISVLANEMVFPYRTEDQKRIYTLTPHGKEVNI